VEGNDEGDGYAGQRPVCILKGHGNERHDDLSAQRTVYEMRKPFLLALLLLAAGCAAAPERLQESISPFDGAREISLEPSLVCQEKSTETCFIRLGLFKRSTMRPDSVILVVVVNGTKPIAGGKSLHFNVDGEVSAFESIDRKTRYGIGKGPHTSGTELCGPSGSCSARRYLVTRDFLKKLMQADKTAVRVDLAGGYLGGVLLKGSATPVLSDFRQFYERVFGPVDEKT